jgi:hypothetical protein
MANSKVFGGDAAKQRADKYAERTGGLVIPLDELPRVAKEHFGLDPWDRKDGVTYTHAVIVEAD